MSYQIQVFGWEDRSLAEILVLIIAIMNWRQPQQRGLRFAGILSLLEGRRGSSRVRKPEHRPQSTAPCENVGKTTAHGAVRCR